MSVKFGDDSTKVVPFDGDDNANDDDSGSGKGEEKGSEASDDDLAAFEKEEEEVESSTKMAKKRQKTREVGLARKELPYMRPRPNPAPCSRARGSPPSITMPRTDRDRGGASRLRG